MKLLVSSIVLATLVALPLSALSADEAPPPSKKGTAGTRSGGEGPVPSPGRKGKQDKEVEATKSKPTKGTRSGGEGPVNSPGGKPAYDPATDKDAAKKQKPTAGTISGGEGPTPRPGESKSGR